MGRGVSGFFELFTVPVQRLTFDVFHRKDFTPAEKLKDDNAKLSAQLAKQKELERENQALRDQFQTAVIPAKKLLPAHIIGLISFIPGVSPVDEIIIDQGEGNGVKVGSIAVYKDNLVGRIVKTSSHMSVIHLLTRKDASFTATTTKTKALGVIKGKEGENLLLDNVVLSDKLEKDDLVVTRGDIDNKGTGYPPDLVVGKIVSVNKKTSALFQTAEVESLVDFERLSVVFIIVEEK